MESYCILFALNRHGIPGSPLRLFLENFLNVWFQVTDVLSWVSHCHTRRPRYTRRLQIPTGPLGGPCGAWIGAARPSCGVPCHMHPAASDAKGPIMELFRGLSGYISTSKTYSLDFRRFLDLYATLVSTTYTMCQAGVIRTEVVIFEAHSTVTHQVSIPLCDRGGPFLECPRRTNVRRERWPQRVHGENDLDSEVATQTEALGETLFGHVFLLLKYFQ